MRSNYQAVLFSPKKQRTEVEIDDQQGDVGLVVMKEGVRVVCI